MANIQFDGNLGQDPELKYFNDGTPVCNLNVGHTPRKFNKQTNEWEDDGATQWYQVSVVGSQAEPLTEALSKGTRVRVEGKLVHRTYQRQDGTAGVSFDVKNATVTLYAPATGQAGQGYQQAGFGGQAGAQAPNTGSRDPWTTQPAGAPF